MVNLVRSSYVLWALPRYKNLWNSIQLTEVKQWTRKKKGGNRYDKIRSMQSDTSCGLLVLRLMLFTKLLNKHVGHVYCGRQEASFCMLQILWKRFHPPPPPFVVFFFSFVSSLSSIFALRISPVGMARTKKIHPIARIGVRFHSYVLVCSCHSGWISSCTVSNAEYPVKAP